jgi:hypothetical protein
VKLKRNSITSDEIAKIRIDNHTEKSPTVPPPKRHNLNDWTARVIGEKYATILNHSGKSERGKRLPLNRCINPIITIEISLPLFTNIVILAANRDREKKNKNTKIINNRKERTEYTSTFIPLKIGKISKTGI